MRKNEAKGIIKIQNWDSNPHSVNLTNESFAQKATLNSFSKPNWFNSK